MTEYKMTLSTTEPNNYVGLIKLRQGDKDSQVLNVTVTENGKLFKIDGLAVFFNSVLPNGTVVRDKVQMIDYANSKLTYKVIDSFLQEVAAISAWFSFENGTKVVDSTKNFRYLVEAGWQSCITQGNYIYELSEIQREIEEIISNKDFTSLISKISSLETDVKYLDARIDNLIATAGDGTVPSELTDIRIGYEGTSYSTAGEAIRKQFELMEKMKIGLVSNKNLFDDMTVTKGYYVNYMSGNLTADAGFSASDFVEITGNIQYTLSNQNTNASGGKNLDLSQLAFYDSDKKYISGLPNLGVEATGALTFTAPSNAAYVRFSLYYGLFRYQLEEGSAKTDYVQHKDIVDTQLLPEELKDINIGYDGTSYSTAGEAIRKQFELMEKMKVGLVSSKNLFDDTTVTQGYYINYMSGNPTANADYSASDFIKITGNVQYTLSNQNTTADYYNENLDLSQLAFYDSDKKYISGLPNSGVEATGALTFTAPSNAAYVRFSLYYGLFRYQLEEGSAKTGYVKHKKQVDIQLLPEEVTNAIDYINNQDKNYVIVSKTGGDYNSILRALKNTPPEIEIRIKGGTYNLYDEYIEFYGADFWVNYTNYASHADDPFYRGLHLEPGRKLFGDANTVVTFDAGTNQVSADVAPYWSLLAPTWDCEAHNIHFKSPVESTVRYIVHDDFAPIDGFGTTLYQDCTFDGSCYGKAQIGGGLGTDMFYKFDNCRFINNIYIHDISYHSRGSNYDIPPCKVIVSNCFGTQRCAFRWMGKSTNISYCTVNNSKFSTIVCIPYDGNATVKNMELVEWNNTQTGV